MPIWCDHDKNTTSLPCGRSISSQQFLCSQNIHSLLGPRLRTFPLPLSYHVPISIRETFLLPHFVNEGTKANKAKECA